MDVFEKQVWSSVEWGCGQNLLVPFTPNGLIIKLKKKMRMDYAPKGCQIFFRGLSYIDYIYLNGLTAGKCLSSGLHILFFSQEKQIMAF